MALQVVTVWWPSREYPERYVDNLRRQVPDLKVLPLYEPHKYQGWLAKFELFRPENAKFRPCLYLDLDTLVVGSLEPFAELPRDRFWMIRQFYQNPGEAESGMMLVPRGTGHIWKEIEELKGLPREDGKFLRKFCEGYLPDKVDGIYSYKVHGLNKLLSMSQLPKDARVVCFHGKPKPHDCGGWAQEYWNAGTR